VVASATGADVRGLEVAKGGRRRSYGRLAVVGIGNVDVGGS
jgi:hypothetical protein